MHKTIDQCIDKIRLLFRKDKEPFLKLYDIMGFYPHNIGIYNVALIHRSCRNRTDVKQQKNINNERLEFLGDALLSAVVADILYQRFKGQQEGFLTTLRSKIVKRETLNELAVNIGLDKLVKHSDHMGNAHNNNMNGNAFEAFLAAIYLDRGYDYCMAFMKDRIFAKYIDIDQMSKKEENYKSKLIEWCQRYQCAFDFVITNQKLEGGNAPKFYSEARIEGVVCGKGCGYSKKESHQQAAQSAYKKVKSNVGFVNQLIEIRNNRVNGRATTPKVDTPDSTAVTPAPEPRVSQKPAGEKQETPKPADKKQDKPRKAEKPAAEKPMAEKPAAEKPAAEKPVAEKPVAEKPVAEKPVAEKPVAEKPVAEKPAPRKAASRKTAAEKTAAEKPAAEKPAKPKRAPRQRRQNTDKEGENIQKEQTQNVQKEQTQNVQKEQTQNVQKEQTQNVQQ